MRAGSADVALRSKVRFFGTLWKCFCRFAQRKPAPFGALNGSHGDFCRGRRKRLLLTRKCPPQGGLLSKTSQRARPRASSRSARRRGHRPRDRHEHHRKKMEIFEVRRFGILRSPLSRHDKPRVFSHAATLKDCRNLVPNGEGEGFRESPEVSCVA